MLFAFHIVLIIGRKMWIQLFSLKLWVSSRSDKFFNYGIAKINSEFKPVVDLERDGLCQVIPATDKLYN